MPRDDTEIVIRDCHALDDFHQCVAVQQAVWGFQDRDVIPVRFFVVAHKIEGHILGVFEASGRMVGFALAVPALKGSTVYLHSHMLAVLPEYRERGLGRRMKLEQRQSALNRGIRLIEWTFDPLELKNAHFNLERLGAIARRYVPNQYGVSSSPLHRGLPTDRLVAEWWLNAPRVIARTTSVSESGASASGLGVPEHRSTGAAVERDIPLDIRRRISVPLAIAESQSCDKLAAAEVQAELRRQFQEAFSEGLVAVGFEIREKTGDYLLGPWAEGK